MKRVFDIILALFFIILLFPLCLLIGIVIRVNSPGPVLFRQKRVGRDCREFYIFKFRSMYYNTPANIPTHLLEKPESFITPVGKFLRKTSLDELPQLINIFKGDMSFVGPRPALYNQKDLIDLRENNKINKVRPGLTGWAQINGRDALGISEKVEYDKFYIDHASIGFDLKILWGTVFKVVRAKDVIEGGTK